MNILHVLLGSTLADWAGAALKVEAFGQSPLSYKRGQTTGGLELEPGDYVLQLTLPDGRTLTHPEPVQMLPNQETQVVVEDPALLGMLADAPEVLSATQQTSLPLEVEARLWRGDWLAFWRRHKSGPNPFTALWEQAMPQPLLPEPTATFVIAPALSEHEDRVLVVRHHEDMSAFAILQDWHSGVATEIRLVLRTRRPGEPLSAEHQLGDRATRSFLGYVQAGERDTARELSANVLAEAEELLERGTRSPLGAVLGCYVMLRFNEIEGLARPTLNLLERYPWLPDALALRVEFLARSGEHEEAGRLLLRLGEYSCPWFRSGVTYLLGRLRLYSRYIDAPQRRGLNLRPTDTRRLGDHIAALGRLAAHLDSDEAVCTYRHHLGCASVT